MPPPPSWPIRMLKAVGAWLLGLVILFEQWGWASLSRAMAAVGRWPLIAALERGIARLPARQALVVFLLPALLILPVKIGAVWLMARGRLLLGVTVLLAAKLASTGIVARIFVLTRPQLMQLAWFARWFARGVALKEKVLGRIRRSLAWRLGRVVRRRLREMARPQ